VAGDHLPTRLPYDEADLRALFDCEAFRALSGAQKWMPFALGDGGPPS